MLAGVRLPVTARETFRRLRASLRPRRPRIGCSAAQPQSDPPGDASLTEMDVSLRYIAFKAVISQLKINLRVSYNDRAKFSLCY